MKKIFLLLTATLITAVTFGQNPVNLSYEAKKKSAGVYDIIITANVDNNWHIYSQNTGKGGPIPTKVSFKANPLVSLTGAVKELGKVEKHYDENFKTNVLYFSNQVQFVQTIKVKGNIKTNIAGTIEFMVCDDSKCLPPAKKTFDLQLM